MNRPTVRKIEGLPRTTVRGAPPSLRPAPAKPSHITATQQQEETDGRPRPPDIQPSDDHRQETRPKIDFRPVVHRAIESSRTSPNETPGQPPTRRPRPARSAPTSETPSRSPEGRVERRSAPMNTNPARPPTRRSGWAATAPDIQPSNDYRQETRPKIDSRSVVHRAMEPSRTPPNETPARSPTRPRRAWLAPPNESQRRLATVGKRRRLAPPNAQEPPLTSSEAENASAQQSSALACPLSPVWPGRSLTTHVKGAAKSVKQRRAEASGVLGMCGHPWAGHTGERGSRRLVPFLTWRSAVRRGHLFQSHQRPNAGRRRFRKRRGQG
jgi:hypothetical protein